MEGDLKEIVGTLMRVLTGARITRAEVEDLAFEADGELRMALNQAYVTLLEYAYDCDAEPAGSLPHEMRDKLKRLLDEIVRLADAAAK